MNTRITDFKIASIDFPDLETYLSDLDKLDNFPFDGLSASEIYHKYYDYARTLPLGHGNFNANHFNEFTFYRVRRNLRHAKDNITSINTYSFPPLKACNQNGRANLAGRSVFYCSNNPHAAILESQPKVSDVVSLSVWKGIAKRPIKFGMCLPLNLPEENDFSLAAEDVFNYMINSEPKIAKDRIEHFKALNDLINRKFISEEEPYHLTSMISNEMLFGDTFHDCIVYASIKSNLKICNLAFHPRSVMENLKLEKVIRLHIIEVENNKVNFNLGKVGFPIGNNFIWKECSTDEIRLFEEIY
jgi:hypothetical protein